MRLSPYLSDIVALTGEKEIDIAEDAFEGCENVTLRVNHASGLAAGDYDDVRGMFAVEMADEHTYEATVVFSDDYTAAQIVLTCACGEEHQIEDAAVTGGEDAQTHRFNYTAKGVFEGKEYAVELTDVASFRVTVNANDGQGDRECYVPVAQGKDYALFTATADWLTGLVPPRGRGDRRAVVGGHGVPRRRDAEDREGHRVHRQVAVRLGQGQRGAGRGQIRQAL